MQKLSETSTPKTIHLSEYQPPAFRIEELHLTFDLKEGATIVKSRVMIERETDVAPDTVLQLDGEELSLLSIKIDNVELNKNAYTIDSASLTIHQVPGKLFCLEIETQINPEGNTSLSGLYLSSGNFCTQCEAEGFRKITYFLDRPDVMTRYTTRVIADKTRYPVLLSNGNCIGKGELDNNQHWFEYQDPFPKPSYLFALVAGDLSCIEDKFVTMSDRNIALYIYVEAHNIDKCDHAMKSLQNSMKWDEEVYGREYDLDTYVVVAVDDFNMGAMENKGLNVFNSKYVLAKPETATDSDYQGIEGVIGHEYFHNWSGNRVTCRDWFQLSLKEGFTVFRDQEFSADMTSRSVKRIEDVNVLRIGQYREDAGPMAHPVRPESYVEINNFYTATVYNKGAEVVRMLHNLLGPESFRRGTDLYFDRHDGQAVTTDDFVKALEDASGIDLAQFQRGQQNLYAVSQAGLSSDTGTERKKSFPDTTCDRSVG
jgi:aminopeptidase N